MKLFRLSMLITLVTFFCLNLHSAAYAQGTVSVTTPSGPPDPAPSQGSDHVYYSSTATLLPSGNTGELTVQNVRYKWTATIKRWQSGSYGPGSYGPCNAPTDFLTADSPPRKTDTANPTTLRTVFFFSGYYEITLFVTITYDLVDQNGTVVQTNTATGSASSQVAAAAPDFSLSGGNSLTVALGESVPVTVSAQPINNFEGTVSLSLSQSASRNGNSPLANPTGVTLSASPSIQLPGFGSSTAPVSTSVTLNVAETATPGKNIPLTIYGDGSDAGPMIESYTTFNLTLVTPYLEIDGPYDSSSSSSQSSNAASSNPIPNKRNPDRSITTDSSLVWASRSADPNSVTYRWYGDNSILDPGTLVAYGLGPFTSNTNIKTASYGWSNDYTSIRFGPTNGSSYSPGPGYLYSGSAKPATGPVATETITVSATRSNGKSISSTYQIRWHYPSDNWRVVSADLPVSAIDQNPDDVAYFIPAGGNKQTIMSPGPNAEFVFPAQKASIATPDGGQVAIYFGGASAAWPGVAEGLGLGTGPIGWGTAAALAMAGGYFATLTPTAPTPQPFPGSYAQYCQDVTTQYKYPFGLPQGYAHVKVVSPNAYFASLYGEVQYVLKTYPGDQGSHDKYFNQFYAGSKMTYTGKTQVTTRIDHYVGDAYGSQGFASSITKDLNMYTGSAPEFQWTYTAP